MSTNNLTVVVVGVGRFGALLARAWQEAGASLLGLVDVNPTRLAEIARRFGVQATYAEADTAIARLNPDAVVIATDEDTHVDIALTALQAGCHVFVEKPLALSGEGARAVAAAAEEADRSVIVGQISRFAEPYSHIQESLSQGRLGDLYTIRLVRDFSRSWFAAFGDRVHPAWESCIHDVDLAIALAGCPVERVFAQQCTAAGGAAPSVVSAQLRFVSGVTATIESAWMVPDGAPQTISGALELDGTIDGSATVIGSSGLVRQRLINDGVVTWTDQAVRNPDLTLWPEQGGRIAGALGREVGHALEVFADGGAGSELMPLHEAVWGVEATEALVRSIELDGPVALDPSSVPRNR